MRLRPDAAEAVRVTATDAGTGKSRSMTLYDTTPENVIEILRRAVVAASRNPQSPIPNPQSNAASTAASAGAPLQARTPAPADELPAAGSGAEIERVSPPPPLRPAAGPGQDSAAEAMTPGE